MVLAKGSLIASAPNLKSRAMRLPLSQDGALLLAFMFLSTFCVQAKADTLAENTVGSMVFDSVEDVDVEAGQSITTGAGGPWNNITFTFLGPSGNVAGGTLFILSRAYSGTPAGLSSATPGFLAQSVGIVGGAWTFSSTFPLAANTQYFLFSNFTFAANSLNLSSGHPTDSYPGGDLFFSSSILAFPTFVQLPPQDWNFRLTGTPVAAAVPEPATLTLVGAALAGLLSAKLGRQLAKVSRTKL